MEIDFGDDNGVKLMAFPEPLLDGRLKLMDKNGVLKQINTIRRIEGIERIREAITRREINSFVHFTRVVNLKSIINHGLCSIDFMKDHGIPYSAND